MVNILTCNKWLTHKMELNEEQSIRTKHSKLATHMVYFRHFRQAWDIVSSQKKSAETKQWNTSHQNIYIYFNRYRWILKGLDYHSFQEVNSDTAHFLCSQYSSFGIMCSCSCDITRVWSTAETPTVPQNVKQNLHKTNNNPLPIHESLKHHNKWSFKQS